jgi:sugar/nucleoside kinase (ribokinase family)
LGLTTSLDTNWDPEDAWKGFADLLRRVDVFLPNENEAVAIAGVGELEPALQKLSTLSSVVAVKRGAQGAIARSASQAASASALPVEVVDTVGAGDSFDAGFLYGFLKGWDLEKSLRLACVCGSLNTRSAGGTAAQPTLQEAMQFMGS